MADQEFDYYLNELQTRPNPRRWWAKAVAICALVGGVYGATVGVTIGAVPGAADIIEIAAAVFAVICGVPGARIGTLIGLLNRMRLGRYYFGIVAAILGAIVGGFLATMLLMAFGAVLGAMAGWFFARALIRRGSLAKLLGGFAGVLVGTFVGVVLWGIHLSQAKALVGLAWGVGFGIVGAVLLLLLAVGTLNSLPRIQAERRNAVDTTFHDEN